MTDRDRLIELFEEIEKDPAITCPHYKTDKTCDTCKYTINNFMCNHTERMVDYLLANGVIVPPCKVGDTVYFLDTVCCNDNYCYNGTCTGCENSELQVFEIHFDLSLYYEISKTVFLTKEEAEKALSERSGEDVNL